MNWNKYFEYLKVGFNLMLISVGAVMSIYLIGKSLWFAIPISIIAILLIPYLFVKMDEKNQGEIK